MKKAEKKEQSSSGSEYDDEDLDDVDEESYYDETPHESSKGSLLIKANKKRWLFRSMRTENQFISNNYDHIILFRKLWKNINLFQQ